MVTLTRNKRKQRVEEVYSSTDKREMSQVIKGRLTQYEEDIACAEKTLYDAERSVVRARHELHRLQHHRDGIYSFCDKQGIKREG